MIKLKDYQLQAINKLKNGSILCGGVGSGKSIVALAYYLLKECGGCIKINGFGSFRKMKYPRDLYIITTAKKRDSLEWDKECSRFVLGKDKDSNAYSVKVTIDSWNNIKKYVKIISAFFIFDEQRVVGSGSWVKSFLTITKKNHWILLSATPGDQWVDYIPVFVANGFYRNKTEFNSMHCVFSRFSKYPRIERYVGTKLLEKHQNDILVHMDDQRTTKRHDINILTDFDKNLYKMIFRDRWNPYENCPVEETGKLIYLIRKVVNSDPSRIKKVAEIFKETKRVIIFYNFTYELELLLEYFKSCKNVKIGQWNGKKHDKLPEGESWVYLVQYAAGCEGWNCTTTDTMIFYSQTYSYRTQEQAAGRIDRINTPYRDLYYYHLKSASSIDLAIYRKLKHKQNFNERSFLKR